MARLSTPGTQERTLGFLLTVMAEFGSLPDRRLIRGAFSLAKEDQVNENA